MSIFTPYEQKMLRLSGPEFWPTLSAELAQDRYIFGRPELKYLSALKQLEMTVQSTEVHHDHIRVVIRERDRGKNTRFTKRQFDHYIFDDDPAHDVKAFLKALRKNLMISMPQKQSRINSQVQTCFYAQPKTSGVGRVYLTSYQAIWL